MKRLRYALPLLALLMVLPTGGATAQVALNGAGATFPAPLYTKIFNEYANQYGIQVNYQAIGSGGGIRGITDRTVDFAGSDAIMTAEQEAAAGGAVLHIPIVSGSVALAMNLPGLPTSTLRLTPESISGIFRSQITNWSDPAIQGENPGLALPDLPIVVVHRADGSGTTFIFTNYLSKVSPEWQATVGSGTSVNWPTGLGGQGNPGVAGEVRANVGAIGYVELAYALQNGLPWALVRNNAGYFLEPNLGTTTAAAEGVSLPADMKVVVTDSSNPDAYPIVGFTWILARQQQDDQAKGKTLVDLLWWMVHDGQAYAPELLYAPLSTSAAERAEAQIRSITYQGQPLLGR